MEKETLQDEMLERIDVNLNALLDEIEKTDPSEPEYTDMVNMLEDMVRMRDAAADGVVDRKLKIDKAEESKKMHGIDPNTILIVGGNLIGIAAVIVHERWDGIITSKAFGMVSKLPNIFRH